MNPQKIYRSGSSLYIEKWRDEEGYIHREGGPAIIWYHEDGVTIESEFWYEHGEPHRLDGPADIFYNKDGRIKKEHWFIDGEWLTDEQVLAHKRNLTINKLLSE